jgi:flavin reductase (DIM6/NTAB) family NADH-FMN oxidoreductase RutF
VGNLSFNFAELQPTQRYKLLCGLVVPRPIALVTSISPDGVVNAAPFSFFNVFSENPALLVLGLQHNEDGSAKDTTRNIHLSGEFVVNLVDEGMADAMNLDAGQATAPGCSARRLRMPAHGGPCLWPAARASHRRSPERACARGCG